MTRLALALGLAITLSGCNDGGTPTSATPLEAVAGTTRLFAGTLTAGDAQFYSFTLPQDSGVFVTLASVTGADSRDPSGVILGLGLGVPRGTGCVLSTRIVTSAALTPQLGEFTTHGVRCVAVFDAGTLAAPVRFAVRIGYFQ